MTPISVATDGTQIWKITHNGVDTHPIHFHLYNVQVLNRITWDNIVIPPEPTELGWKETVRISPLEDTIVAMRPIVPTLPFAVPDSQRLLNPGMPERAVGALNGNAHEAGFNNVDYAGIPTAPIANEVTNFDWEYVFHCHILSHEEMDMMRPVTVNVNWATPPAPTGLTFTRGSVILNWTDTTPVTYTDLSTWDDPVVGDQKTNPTQEVGFRIWRAPVISGVTGTFAIIANVPANSKTYTDTTTSLDPTVTYEYKITAWNESGDSPFSNVATAPGLGATTTSVITSRTRRSLGRA